MSAQPRHPILVDTSGFVAAANTDLWEVVREQLRLTTTNVCRQELRRHVEERREHAPDGSRERYLHNGSRKALEALEADDVPFSCVTCVPRPHGEDAGEESLRREVVQHTDEYEVVVVMDDAGSRSIRRALDRQQASIPVVAPTYLLYLLYDRGIVAKKDFCHACASLLKGEGWTGYRAVKVAWEEIPVDCSPFLDDELLPK